MNPVGTLNLSSFPIHREKEIIYQWNVNDYVVYLIKKQEALEYKTIDEDKKEIYAGHIETPESESIEEMVSHLKACKVMVNENGIAHFLQNFHTWESVNRDSELEFEESFPLEDGLIHSFPKSRVEENDPNVKVSLVLGVEGLVWNVFQRITKECSFHPFQEATIPSLRCHPETVALIEKIKTEALSKPPLLYSLISDFTVRALDSEFIKKEYEAIKTELREYEKALVFYEAGLKVAKEKENQTIKEYNRRLRIVLQECEKSFKVVNDAQTPRIIDLKNLKKAYEELHAILEKCKESLEFEKFVNKHKNRIVGSMGFGVGAPFIYLAKNAISSGANAVKNYLGSGIIGSFAGDCTKIVSGSAILLSAVIVATVVSIPFFPNESGLDTDKLDALQKRMTPLSLQKPLLIEIEPISTPSRIDERARVSKFTWAVTLVTHMGSNGNHAKIIVEGINDGFYSNENPRIKNENTVKNGEKFTYMAEFNPPIKSQIFLPTKKLKYNTRTEIWMVTSDRVKKMLASIEEEKSLQQPTFNYWGIHSKIYKLNPRKLDLSGKVGDNCFTWARKKLRILNIDLGEDYTDHLAAIARKYTKEKEEYEILPVQQLI